MKKIFFTFLISSFGLMAQAQHENHDHSKMEASNKQTKAVGEKATADANAKNALVAEVKAPLADALFLTESEFDFGKIPQAKPVTHVFKVKNSGTAPYKLDNVQASCGCTTPVWDREKVIAPGETTDITVGYNAAAEGAFNKTITVTYNGTQSKTILIKGEVWKTPAASAPENKAVNELKF